MNRKFFLNGRIVSKLMQMQEMSALGLSMKLGKTRQAISQIQKRENIKDSDANKILAAFGLSFEEVEKMDSEGYFNKNYVPYIPIDLPESQVFQDFSVKIEGIVTKLSEQYTADLNRLRAELVEKDAIILAKNKIIEAFTNSMIS